MKFLIKKCPRCGTYTLKEYCPKCQSKATVAAPPRFSPVDKYVKYRIMAKVFSNSEADKSLQLKMDAVTEEDPYK